MLINIPWCLTGSKLAPAHLDSIYLTSRKAIGEEERLCALTAYMADLVVSIGELDLMTGRAEGRKRRNQQQRLKVMWLI